MNRRRTDSVDQSILVYCSKDRVVLNGLLKAIPGGTLYRHVAKLLAEGALRKKGRVYQTTEVGQRRIAEFINHIDWNLWDSIYPPIQYVPTSQHRAVLELTTAAVVARQSGRQEDHHPGFVVMGPTLAWKTSLVKFECLLVGVSSTEAIVDLTTETGRSLLVRRDGKGKFEYKRALLDGSLIGLDDFLEAEGSLRSTIHHLLSGRTVVPLDNTILRITPVPLITLNPRPKPTLEEQTTFSTAQLRRIVVTNLANVSLPDLANTGHRALEAASKHGPLRLPPPTLDAQAYRPQIVALVREILLRQMWPRVDTEMIITMVTGMTAFISDPERAIQQTIYDFAITAETIGWTCSGWSEVVSRFSLHVPLSTSRHQEQTRQEVSPDAEVQIIMWRSAMEGYRESVLPPFVISDANKARLIAIASRENVPLERVDHVLEVILDNWTERERNGSTLDEAYSALRLCKDLGERSMSVADVKLAARFRQIFREGTYTHEEFQDALDLLPMLREHGLTVQDDRIETVLGLTARLLSSERSLTEFDAWLPPKTEDLSQGE